MKRILIAFDGSDPAKRAFRRALEMARLYEARLFSLAVAQLPEPAAMVESTALLEQVAEHFEKDFAEQQAEAEAAGVELETQTVVGHVAEQIVHFAAEHQIDLIVMGHRGKSLIQRWLLGSVSKRVLSYAPCSVLVVR